MLKLVVYCYDIIEEVINVVHSGLRRNYYGQGKEHSVESRIVYQKRFQSRGSLDSYHFLVVQIVQDLLVAVEVAPLEIVLGTLAVFLEEQAC